MATARSSAHASSVRETCPAWARWSWSTTGTTALGPSPRRAEPACSRIRRTLGSVPARTRAWRRPRPRTSCSSTLMPIRIPRALQRAFGHWTPTSRWRSCRASSPTGSPGSPSGARDGSSGRCICSGVHSPRRRLLAHASVRGVFSRVGALADHVERVPTRPVAVESLAATCVLVRRRALDQIGGFDESYFLYGEDLDLCRRLRNHGWRLVALPHRFAQHDGGASSSTFG